MKPPRIEPSLEIYRGTSGGLLLPVRDAADQSIDPTGWTAWCTVREYPGATERLAVLTATCDERGVLISWTGDETSQWRFRDGEYDVWVRTLDDQTVCLAAGTLRVIESVTTEADRV